jgi:hypothetical protein
MRTLFILTYHIGKIKLEHLTASTCRPESFVAIQFGTREKSYGTSGILVSAPIVHCCRRGITKIQAIDCDNEGGVEYLPIYQWREMQVFAIGEDV